MLGAALTSLLFTLWAGPYCINLLYRWKTGQSIRVEDCPLLAELHKKKRETPTMGGLLILSAMLLSLVLWMDIKSAFTWILLIITLGLGGLGAYDDFLKLKQKNSKGISAKKKFFIQISLAFLIGLYLAYPSIEAALHFGKWFDLPSVKLFMGSSDITSHGFATQYFLPFFKEPLFILSGSWLLLGALMSAIVITGSSNAVNLADGLDGLASGCLILVSMVFGIVAFLSNNIEMSKYLNIAYIEGSGEIGIYLFALCGACLGFLWYNGYPAQVFMGDTGSLALGGVIGVSAVLLRRELLLGLVGGIFVAEALSVILQVLSFRLRKGKRVFLCAPLHHHFEYKGWPETKVVLRFWIIGLILAILGIFSLKLQ